jgi:alcohol dehydrogenase
VGGSGSVGGTGVSACRPRRRRRPACRPRRRRRVPFADLSTHPLPTSVDDASALLLADILPTSYEVGVLNGHVRPGDVVAVVGAGPIGLAAVVTARLFSPSAIVVIDPAEARLAAAKQLGAQVALTPGTGVEQAVLELTEGLGADVAIEAVGVPETFELCTRLVRPGGRVANAGVHGKPATLHLETLWIRDVTITTGLVDTFSTPRLLRMLSVSSCPSTASSPIGSVCRRCSRRTTFSPARRTPAH